MIHYQKNWETLIDERVEKECITTITTIDGVATEVIVENERRYVVLETEDLSCRMVHSGVGIDVHFSTYFGRNIEAYMDDFRRYCRRYKVNSSTTLEIEMIRWYERVEYLEVGRDEVDWMQRHDGIRYKRTEKRIEETEPEVLRSSRKFEDGVRVIGKQ